MQGRKEESRQDVSDNASSRVVFVLFSVCCSLKVQRMFVVGLSPLCLDETRAYN